MGLQLFDHLLTGPPGQSLQTHCPSVKAKTVQIKTLKAARQDAHRHRQIDTDTNKPTDPYTHISTGSQTQTQTGPQMHTHRHTQTQTDTGTGTGTDSLCSQADGNSPTAHLLIDGDPPILDALQAQQLYMKLLSLQCFKAGRVPLEPCTMVLFPLEVTPPQC